MNKKDKPGSSMHIIYDFYRQLRQVSRSIERYRDYKVSSFPMTGAQLYALFSVYELGECTNAELAEFSGLAKNSVTNLITFLSEQGYVNKYSKHVDGRIITLCISSKGREIIIKTKDLIDDSDPRIKKLTSIITEDFHSDQSTFKKVNDFFRGNS